VKAALVVTALGGAAVVAGPLADHIERDTNSRTATHPVAVAGAAHRREAAGDTTIVAAPSITPAAPALPVPAPTTPAAAPATSPIDRAVASRSASVPGRAKAESTEKDPLERELELVESGRRAAARGAWDEALESGKRHRAEFPSGALGREATALVVEALCRTGERMKAKSDALTWLGTTAGAQLFAQKCDEPE
jgi:hypothetical protein